MAYREIGMWEILEVLRRVHRGERQRAIARATGHSRSTIRRYVTAARELGWAPLVVEPDEALAVGVGKGLRPVAAEPGLGESEARLRPHQAQIRTWLEAEDGGRGLRLSKVRELLRRQGVEVPYSSLHRFASKHCGFADARRITVRVADVAPGELAEVDFGRLGLVPDPEIGHRRVLHALIVTLVYSRHQYVHVAHSQTLSDLIEGLEDAWTFFGGVPARVVLDNLKAAVTKADRYDPVFQRTFAEYARWRGFVIDAAVPRHAKGKPHVERQVQYLRENFFRGESWLGRDHVQREAVRWCVDIAGQRVHGTTRKRPSPSSRRRRGPRSSRSCASGSTRPSGRRRRSTPITTSSSARPSTRFPPATWASASGSAATRSSSASTSEASWSRPTSVSRRAPAPPTTSTTPRSSPPMRSATPSSSSGKPAARASTRDASWNGSSPGPSRGRSCARVRSSCVSPTSSAVPASRPPAAGPSTSSSSTCAASKRS